jgi:hypothetical protein
MNFKPIQLHHFEPIQDNVHNHGWRASEVIFELHDLEATSYKDDETIEEYLDFLNIKTEELYRGFKAADRDEAFRTFDLAFRSKANHTTPQREFTVAERSKLFVKIESFLSNPRFFVKHVDSPGGALILSRREIDFTTFWESHGLVFIDQRRIGMAWVNDMY